MAELARDARRQLRWASPSENTFEAGWSGAALECQLVKDYHKVERGLSLRSPRQPFGAQVHERLKLGLASAEPSGPEYLDLASSALRALNAWNSHAIIDENVAPSQSADAVWGGSSDPSPRFACDRSGGTRDQHAIGVQPPSMASEPFHPPGGR